MILPGNKTLCSNQPYYDLFRVTNPSMEWRQWVPGMFSWGVRTKFPVVNLLGNSWPVGLDLTALFYKIQIVPVLMLLQIYGCKAGHSSDFKIIFIIININILGTVTSNQRTCMFMFMSRVPENRFWIGPKKDRRTKLRRDGRAPGRSGSDEVRQTKMNFFAKNYHNRTFIKKGSFKFNA